MMKMEQRHRVTFVVMSVVMTGLACMYGYWAWRVMSWAAVGFLCSTVLCAISLFVSGVFFFVGTSADQPESVDAVDPVGERVTN